MLFGVGGGMAIVEGLAHVLAPQPIESRVWAYAVLGIASIFEGYSWYVALQEVCSTPGSGAGIWETVRHSKDPAVFTVLFEDTAALLGFVVAFLGVFLGELLDLPYADGIASMVISVMLAEIRQAIPRSTASSSKRPPFRPAASQQPTPWGRSRKRHGMNRAWHTRAGTPAGKRTYPANANAALWQTWNEPCKGCCPLMRRRS